MHWNILGIIKHKHLQLFHNYLLLFQNSLLIRISPDNPLIHCEGDEPWQRMQSHVEEVFWGSINYLFSWIDSPYLSIFSEELLNCIVV